MTKFQAIFIAIFIIFIIGGVTLFATYKSKDTTTALPPITIWGTFPESVVSSLVQEINNTRTDQITVNYVEMSSGNFNKNFIEALARGEGPDAILIPQEMMLRHADKVIPIPSLAITERDFTNAYINEANLYVTSSGIMAVPFTVDPLVMYWNRDLFTNAGIAVPPQYWDDFGAVVTKIDQKDANSNIRRSAIALGEFSNINHAREILGALLLQAGNPITSRTSLGVEASLGDGSFNGSESSTPAVNFFTQFSDPRNPQYSWNRSLPTSKNWFLSGSLATYFGFSSELFDLRSKNPNIDFDVAPFPQPKNAKNRVTYGQMFGLSIVRSTKNPSAAFTIIKALTEPGALAMLNKISYLPPVRRDMIATGSTDKYQSIFYDSALISKGWLDMDPAKTSLIFQNMVETITSGRANTYTAIQTAQGELGLSLQNL